MTMQILIVLILTFIIYVIGTLAYSVRVVGIKTGRIAVAFAVFNIFALISRTAVTFQTPLLAKTIENSINSGNPGNLLYMFRWILFSATVATAVGALLIPTFIKLFSKAVKSFSIYRSVPKLVLHSFSKSGIEQFKESLSVPTVENLSHLKTLKGIPKKIIILNIIACAISTTGSLSSLYAGSLNPDLRATCSALSPVINGFSTILMYIVIDPFLSVMTDDVIRGERPEIEFSRCIIFIIGGLFAGTILAQFILVPASEIIAFIAKLL